MTSFVATVPDSVAAAGEDLATISSELRQAAATAVSPTTGLVPAAGDEASTAISQLFANYGNEFQAVNAEASLFQAEFV